MIKSPPTKLMLCATTQYLLVGLWSRGILQGSQVFNNDENGHAGATEYFKQYLNTPVYLIADAVEEDYRLEHIPHTSGAAKSELIQRKLNQFYRGLEYRTAHYINREQDKRKDDRYLFVALNNVDFLKNWVNIIQTMKMHLVGVYLLPMLSQLLVKQLKLMSPHILLCEKLSSGLRQTYLHNGRLRMSRLVPTLPVAPNQVAKFFQVETEKTRLYLISQRFIKNDTPLNVVLVSIGGSTQHISQLISLQPGFECSDINLSEVAKTLNLPVDLIEQTPELLHMQLLASGHLVDNLAPAPLTKEYTFNQLKRGIKVATIILAFIGLIAAAILFYQGYKYQSAFKEAEIETVLQQHNYEEAAKNFPVTTISSGDLKVAVELDKMIEIYPKSPRRMMQVISSALEQSPEILLNRLHWVLTNDINVNDEDKGLALPASAPQPSATFTPDQTKLYEMAYIGAEISGFTGDYRSALNSAHQFVEKLKANQNVVAVEVLQEPVNASSFVNLEGSTTDEQAVQAQPALFKLKIILKAPDEIQAETGVK